MAIRGQTGRQHASVQTGRQQASVQTRRQQASVQTGGQQASVQTGGQQASVQAGGQQADVQAIRRHFMFPELGRIATNNAASTQPPRELLALYESLAPGMRTSIAGSPARHRR